MSITSKSTPDTMKKVSYNPFSMGPVSMALPTTEAQREMLATLALDRDATLCYNESLAIEISGHIDASILNLAFQEILKRHNALRSVFSGDGKYFFIKEYSPQPIEFNDWSQDPDQLKKIEDFKRAQVLFKFDLKNGPLFIGTLIKKSPEAFTFVVTAHHIICDGWSFAVLLTELTTIYSALIKNVPFSFEPAFQFSDYAYQEAKNGLNNSHKSYWVNKFKSPVNSSKLPLDFERPKFRTYNSQRVEIEIHEELVKKIKKYSSANGCSLYTTLMGVFQVLLHKLSGSPELVVGMASAAQSESGKNDLVGHLVNLLPLRTQLNGNVKFKSFLKEIRTLMLDAFDHQHFSFGSLLKELSLERNPAEIPLLNTVFNIDQQSPGQGLKFDGPKAQYSTTARAFENFELFVNVVSCENRLIIECQYNSNLFKMETVTNWFATYVKMFEAILLNPELSISDIPNYDLYIPAKTKNTVAALSTKLPVKKNSDPFMEAKLINVWKEILGLEKVGSLDNFFAVGGHSLLALELVSRITEEFKINISIRDIFENPTIDELTLKIGKNGLTEKPALTPIVSLAERDAYPVTHNQMQIWYLEEMFAGTNMHNLPSSIRLKFALDRKVLEDTLSFLVKRHPALRTAITVENGEPVQKVLNANLAQFKIELPLISASESDIVSILNKEANFVFNKENPPLFKAKLYQLGKDDFVFFFMVHHAIWDGWCFDIFFEELNTVYSAFIQGKQPVFETNPEVSYTDFSVWLKDNIDSGKLDHQLDFWKRKLALPLPVLELPNDFKRPVKASHEGATLSFQLTAQQADKLRSYAKGQETSLYNVMLTAFKVTLARYANLDDIIVGSPVRCRNQSQLLKTIGYFVNTVSLRSHIRLTESFEANLKIVNHTCLEAFDHQQLPFQVVLNQIEHTRDPGRTPIFQTFFSYQDVNNRQAILNNHPYVQINIDKASTHTDLDLWVKSNDKKIEGAFEYRKDLFNEVTIQRFYECFMHILNNLGSNVGVPLLNDSILPAAQRELVLKKWNDTTVDASNLQPFHKTFESVSQQNLEKVAVSCASGEISYKSLNEKANKVAHGLIKAGVKPGDLVGLSHSRDVNLIISILGILKAGAGYVPLDPAFPQDRLDYMLESSNPKALITEPALEKRFASFGKLTLAQDLISDESLSTNNPAVTISNKDTMYVIYTSGSTGKPKGVQISHGALANFLVSMGKAPGLSSQDKLLAVTTLSFDIATLELYLPLVTGASLYLASSYDVMDGKALRTIIENEKISVMQATPSSWRLLLAAGWSANKQFKALCGGEPFPKDLANKLLSICGSVWNMYGPTETTVWSTTKKLSLDDENVTIGYPIDNTYTYILDEGRNLAPIGAPGELYIGGLGLAEGYFKRPDLTSEKFVSNPFVSGEKMYATGDFARYLSNGEIECLGRQDGQVKVRGYRIELGEIEAVLSRIATIKENAVITKEVKSQDVRIIAFLVIKPGQKLDEKNLRDELSVTLPKYMIPSHFYPIEDLPKTLNGKIDKKTLGTKVPSMHEEVVAPVEVTQAQDEFEQNMNLLWNEILNTKILATDNFFNAGGNSLLAVKLFSKISQRYQINLPLSLLLEAETFSDFVIAVKQKLIPVNNSPLVQQGSLTSAITIQAGGKLNPVFCFHGVGGNVLNYKSLAPAVSGKRPLIGLQSQGMNKLSEMNLSVEDMARHYIKEMKTIQPQGPYYLAGGSMGGMIALEVAQQLLKQGEAVEKLVMFDTFGPKVNIRSYDESERNFFKNLKISLYYRRKIFINKLKVKILNLIGAEIPLEIRLFNVEMNNYRSLWNYRPQPIKIDLYLIRAKMRAKGWYSDPDMGWKETIGGAIHTYEIEGSHGDFIESPELVNAFSKLV